MSLLRAPRASGPLVPSRQEIEGLLERALEVLSPDQLWVHPDCDLKTRRCEKIAPALTHLVEAARRLRDRVGVGQAMTDTLASGAPPVWELWEQ